MISLSHIVAVGWLIGWSPAMAAEAPIFRCVISYLQVDGLPLVHHGWCTRARPDGPIIPLISEEGQGLVFGIQPWSAPPAPPIPKHQRPLE